jgi:hypothetical protein
MRYVVLRAPGKVVVVRENKYQSKRIDKLGRDL